MQQGSISQRNENHMTKSILSLLFLMTFSFQSHALTVREAGLDELSEFSQNIIMARVVQKQLRHDVLQSQKVVFEYTVEILDVIKGDLNVGELYEFKQMASGRFPVEGGVVVNQPIGFPEYQESKTYLFFLPQPHPESGLLAPTAIHQGVYQVHTNQQGQTLVPDLAQRLPRLLQKNVWVSPQSFSTINLSQNKNDLTYTTLKQVIQMVQE